MVSSLLALLPLLVTHALHSRVDLPPCQVPKTGLRYALPVDRRAVCRLDRAKALTKAYRDGKPCPWYGSERALDEWLPWLLEPWAASLSSCTK